MQTEILLPSRDPLRDPLDLRARLKSRALDETSPFPVDERGAVDGSVPVKVRRFHQGLDALHEGVNFVVVDQGHK